MISAVILSPSGRQPRTLSGVTQAAAAFQALPDRMAGLPVDDTLHDGVPHWLVTPLQQWLTTTLHGDEWLARRVLIRLRWPRNAPVPDSMLLSGATDEKLLAAVNALLQLHPDWDRPATDWGGWDPTPGSVEWLNERLADLEELFIDGGSLYTVDLANHCLTRRVDATVAEAFAFTVKATDPTAADHLRTAWAAAYGLDPDPDKAFHEAVRAVETIACPLVQPKHAANGKATFGTVLGELRNAGQVWQLVLPDATGQPRDVAPLVAMLELLWQAQVSRHGGAPKSRRQDQAEAEAALHLATTLVQWLGSGVLYRR